MTDAREIKKCGRRFLWPHLTDIGHKRRGTINTSKRK